MTLKNNIFILKEHIWIRTKKSKTTRMLLATNRIKQACRRHVLELAVCAARGTVSQPKIGFVLGSVTSPLPLLRPVRESRKKEHPAALCSIPRPRAHTHTHTHLQHHHHHPTPHTPQHNCQPLFISRHSREDQEPRRAPVCFVI